MSVQNLYDKELFEWCQSISKIGTWYVNVTEDKLHWSDETYRIHEMKPGTPIDIKEALKYYHEDDRDTIEHAVATGIEKGKPWDLVLRIITEKGNEKTVRASGRPVFNKEKDLVRLEGIFHELNLMKEEQGGLLKLSHERADFEEVLDKFSIIARTDSFGRITYANEMFCGISGYSRKELLGKDHRILNSHFHSKDFFKNLWNTVKEKKEWRGEIRNKAKDGSIYWVDTVIKPIVGLNGEVEEYLAIRRDVTHIKEKHDADLKMARLAAIGETTAQIVHDVMNPLAIISGNISRLERQFSEDVERDDKKSLDILGKMENSVSRIQDIFSGLRGNLIGENKVERFSMRELLKSTLDELEMTISKNKFDIRFDTDLDFDFVGNESQIKQVFVNLIKNGIQANLNNEEKWVKINLLKIGGYKVVQIMDSGPGVPLEVQSKMFDSLYTTKQDEGGTGLGLGICKQIVEGHNGKISLNLTSANTLFEVVFKDS